MSAPLASTLNLILQTAVLVILIVAITLEKRNPKIGWTLHHNMMALAILLNIVGVILVMLPSEVAFLSGLGAISSTTLLLAMGHGIFGALGLIFGIAFVLKFKPRNLKIWMRLNAFFWFTALVFGFAQYLNIAGAL